MKAKEFFNKFSNLLLTADDYAKYWALNPGLRRSWRWFLAWLISTLVLSIAVNLTPIKTFINALDKGPYWYRLTMSFIYALGIGLLIAHTIAYFKYTLEGKKEIRLLAVWWFYCVGIVLFGILHYYLFLEEPCLYIVDATHVEWTSELNPSATWLTKFHFIIYSTLESVGARTPYISSSSLTVAIIGYFQKLYAFALVALLVAGYVNQKARLKGSHNKDDVA